MGLAKEGRDGNAYLDQYHSFHSLRAKPQYSLQVMYGLVYGAFNIGVLNQCQGVKAGMLRRCVGV